MLPAGNWKLDAATPLRLDSNSNSSNTAAHKLGQQPSNTPVAQPPRAIFVRLSDELLQQLKAAQPGNAAFQLELAGATSTSTGNASASGSRSSTPTPVAINLGDNSYPLVRPVNKNQTRTKVTELVVQPSNKLTSSSSLQLAATNAREQYEVGPSTSIRHNDTIPPAKERTPASMGERLRERNAQMQKEKESRKIVIVEDDGFSSSGGKGKKSSNKAAMAAPNLLRASAITAKRAASPAGIPARQGQAPSLGPSAVPASTSSRPPNRLVANEAAKGLMKKSNLVQSGPVDVQDTSPMPVVSTNTTTGVKDSSVDTGKMDTTAAQPTLVASVIVDKPKVAPLPGSPARRQFHQMKVDADDLASASSDSEEEDDAPLAVRIQSPIKTHFPVEQLSKNASKPVVSHPSLTARRAPVDSSTSASESSDRETPKAARGTAVAMASISRRLSPDSAPSSRASSPGRAVGGPKTVAKTSGGSRLSRPVPKVSPKASPSLVAVPTLPSDSATSTASSASTSRPPSPPPTIAKPHNKQEPVTVQDEASVASPAKLSVDAVPKQSSRTPSPLPSPGLHPLPAKPPVSPSYSRQANLYPSPTKPPSPLPPSAMTAEKERSPAQSMRPSLLPIGLPANPITGVMPNIPKSPSSLHPPTSLPHSHSNHLPSGHSTPGASPIVSHFPNSHSARNSKSPSSGPLKTVSDSGGPTKRKDLLTTSGSNAHLSDSSANKKKKLNGGSSAPSPLSNTTGSEEDGEAEEEGEYRPSPPSVAPLQQPNDEKDARGRPNDVKPVQSENTAPTSDKPRIISKGGLPSFTKKGRMSDLQKGRDDSVPPRSQSASRANTPISYGPTDFSTVDGIRSPIYKPKVTGPLRITNDADFVRYSTEFQEKLYPAYMRLYTRLDRMKESILNPAIRGMSPSLTHSPQDISQMVEEVNERSKELERIKIGLWEYNDDRKDERNGTSRSNSSGMARVK